MVYLAQTDTTAGFLSKDFKKINKIKNRDEKLPCLITTSSFKNLFNISRIPIKFKNKIRKSRKISFLYPNDKLVRVVKDHIHCNFLEKYDWLYSSSANLHKSSFDEKWAKNVADIVIDEQLFEGKSSEIYKISRKKIKLLRR